MFVNCVIVCQMTEMAHGQLTALKHPSIPSASSEEEEHSSHTRQQSTEKAHMERYIHSCVTS